MWDSARVFRREIAVAELIAEKHADNGSDGKGVENPALFTRREAEARQITKDERQPRAPNEKLERHHHEQLGTIGHKNL